MSTLLPPGPRYPRALQTLGWGLRPGPFLERCRARYGDVFTLRIAQEPDWVVVSDPDAVRQVFTGDPRLLHAGEGNRILRPFLGEHSVLLLDEQPHMTQRKLLLPPFHGERMQRYGELMAGVARREIARWPAGEPLAVDATTREITLEVILRAVFGVQEEDRLERLRALLRDMIEWSSSPRQLVTLAVLGPDRIGSLRPFRVRADRVDAAIYEEIAARRADARLTERDDILSMLLQARHEDTREPMSDVELRDELMTLLTAGHETTATALAWAVERLVHNPDVLERLTEELRDGGEAYLDAVVKETLRLRPVIAIVARRLTAPMELAGYRLPAGVVVVPCIHLVHRREDIYPEPKRFRPERFLENDPGTYTWFPFGGGVRRCLGASFALFEMKVVLREIVTGARLAPASPSPERVRRRTITLVPERGGEVVVAR